jgi:hypothetical protein
MFTIPAEQLSAILDKVAVHRPTGSGCESLDVIVLDCTADWLHAVTGGHQTLAVARTRVSGDHWTASVAAEDAATLRGWLAVSHHVSVEYTLAGGHPLLHFTEGMNKLTVPAAPHPADLPWRQLLYQQTRRATFAPGPLTLGSDHLARWSHAGEHVQIRHAGGQAPFLITAGKDFIGLQTPLHTEHHEQRDRAEAWADSMRPGRFTYAGAEYEIGARYLDSWNTPWQVTAKPAPGEELYLVLCDHSRVALPLSSVLAVGGRLRRAPA